MVLANLTVSNFTLLLAVLWCLIALLNGKSLIMLLSLVGYTLIQAYTTTDFHAFIICSVLYFYFSQSSIKSISCFRKVFFCFGAVYFVGAVDQAVYFHLSVDLKFDVLMPYLITIINAYVVAALISMSGGRDARHSRNIRDYCKRRADGLSLLQTSQQDNRR